MRVCLVTHGFPPYELTGVENYTHALARASAAGGLQVEVFAARRVATLPDRALRREVHAGWGVTWVNSNSDARDPVEALDPPGIAEAFERFLERERPEVVHFQHVLKLGLGLIDAARERGIPTLYTAHDYYPVCHRFTLLRPDLSRCDTLGDSIACARCDLALALLNRQPDLGDYQIGALAEQLDPAAHAALVRLIGGDELGAGVPQGELDAARERRAALDARRREVFARVDLVLAPTEFLARALVRGGLDPARVRRLGYGIETGDLAPLRDAAPVGAGPLRFGFIGGHSKHKGVHVLLDAWRQLGAVGASLDVWGGSSDARYVERLRAAAQACGARWRGSFARAQLPSILRELDALVVPSIWVENQPLVIREALAAGRPVLASRVGALPESVRDGVDGWLFEAGDAADLARLLRELCGAPQRLRDLAARLEPVKDLGAHVRELGATYRELLDARRAADSSGEGAAARRNLPEHVRVLHARHAELAALPTRELYARVLAGLEGLAPRLGAPTPGLARILSDGIGARSRAQEHIDDARAEHAWRERQHSTDEGGLRALSERVAWREGQLAEREKEVAWLRTNEQSLQAERAWLRETLESFERERNWLRDELANQKRELEWRAEQVQSSERELTWRREQVGALEKERDWLREEVDTRDYELGWLRGQSGAGSKRVDAVRAQLTERLERGEALARETDGLLGDARAADGTDRERLGRARELVAEQARELRAALAAFSALLPGRATPDERSGPGAKSGESE